jgi:multidrug efflux pump subunit AcrA (membrane-fusion protein)
VRPGQPIVFSAETLPGRSFTGTVKYLNPAMNEADRSVAVVAEVPNADGQLRGGVGRAGPAATTATTTSSSTPPRCTGVPNARARPW